MSNDLEQRIAAKPGPKVTKEQIEARIKSVEYHRIGVTCTICNITLDNGYSVRGESACVSPENYDEKIGQELAYKKAFDNWLWPLFGFMLAEDLYRLKESTKHCVPGDAADNPTPPYQLRVIAKKADLDKKIERLDAFVYSTQTFEHLPAEEKDRLKAQLEAMTRYSVILSDRIAAFDLPT